MCEIPSNVILAKAFAQRFDGFSIGSNDLTQLTLGVDRDSAELAELFDEQDEAVKWMIRSVIEEAHKAGAKVGLCGQAPSDHPEFADFLVDCSIDFDLDQRRQLYRGQAARCRQRSCREDRAPGRRMLSSPFASRKQGSADGRASEGFSIQRRCRSGQARRRGYETVLKRLGHVSEWLPWTKDE